MDDASAVAKRLRDALKEVNAALEDAFKARVAVDFQITKIDVVGSRVPMTSIHGEASRMKVEFSEPI